MKNFSVMIKPSSAACNLRCKYCFYADVAKLREVPSFGRMTQDTLERMLENIRTDLTAGDSITFGFQGGEPTLAGLPFFREFVRLVGEWDPRIRIGFNLQTNGMLLDEEWCKFLAENNFLVGISLDILPECHDFARVDIQDTGTYKRVCQAIRLLREYRVEFNVLCTLTNPVARHPGKVWKEILRLDLQYVQFTPCLDKLETPGLSPYALSPSRFASFYIQLYRLWEEAFRRGQYRSVKLFDDIVNLLAFGVPTACGIDGHCRPQLVIEADGSVYPCDFYCLDHYCAGNLAENPLHEIYASPVYPAFAGRSHTQPELCASCPYARMCGGGCKRMQRAVCCAPDDAVCGYRMFLDTAIGSLQEIARDQRARRGY